MKNYIILLIGCVGLAACQPESGTVHGYVEGEFVRVAPTSGGLLKKLSVERGQSVQTDDPLFSLDLIELSAQRDSAAASVQQVQAELNDLLKGERPEEIEILRQQQEQAQATLINAQAEYDRVLPLSQNGAVSLSKRDTAKAALDSAKARMAELEAQLKTANLGARVDRIEAMKASVEVAKLTLTQAEKKLQDAAPRAPVAGMIEDTLFRPGEYVAAGQPVVVLFPPENVKIRFYISQEIVPQLKMDQAITVSCDGCAAPIDARISYIAPESEYTPPVIYSVESRDKLVFLIEAQPDAYTSALRPGLPVDIDLRL